MNRPHLRRAISREEVRTVDRVAIERFHIPGVVLMENAGRGVAEKIVELDLPGPVAICCGKGNNAGDGFLQQKQSKVLITCFLSEIHLAPRQPKRLTQNFKAKIKQPR